MSKETQKNHKPAILHCPTCKKHKFQDETYGDKMRVHNPKASTKDGNWRCTVCAKVR